MKEQNCITDKTDDMPFLFPPFGENAHFAGIFTENGVLWHLTGSGHGGKPVSSAQ